MKKLLAPFAVGLALSGIAGAGLATPANAATPPAASSTTTPGHHPVRAWLRSHRRAVMRHVAQISAQTIGITPEALSTALHSGQSIAQVAQAHNVDPQTVVNAIVQAGDARVGQAVDRHKLTPVQGAKIEAALPGAVTKLVGHVFYQRAA